MVQAMWFSVCLYDVSTNAYSAAFLSRRANIYSPKDFSETLAFSVPGVALEACKER